MTTKVNNSVVFTKKSSVIYKKSLCKIYRCDYKIVF